MRSRSPLISPVPLLGWSLNRRTLRGVAAGIVLGTLAALWPGSAGLPARSAPVTVALWSWPIDAPHIVTRGYEAPAHRYGSGHRGIDIEADTGAAVYSPADGVVTFTGFVVDRPLISIRHSDGLVSSIEPVAATVSTGDSVSRGQPIGTRADVDVHCDGCVHLGARMNGEYLSPLALLGGIPRAVLLPID